MAVIFSFLGTGFAELSDLGVDNVFFIDTIKRNVAGGKLTQQVLSKLRKSSQEFRLCHNNRVRFGTVL